MEAEIFEAVGDVLSHSSRRLILPFKYSSRINKIVWSTWDYIIGPDYRFVWEVCLESNLIKPRRATDDLLLNLSLDEQPTVSSSQTKSTTTVIADVHTGGDAGSSLEENEAIVHGVEEEPTAKPFVSKKVSEASYSVINENECCHDETNGARWETDIPQSLSDESYIAVHSLSSEMCRLNVGDSIDFKLLSVPDRSLLIVCFIFSAKHKDSDAVQSISFALSNLSDWQWLLTYRKLLKSYMRDVLLRLKISLIRRDNFNESICRLTTYWNDLISLLQSVDNYGLSKVHFGLSDTHLAATDLTKNDFLCASISTCLQANCHVIVTGRNEKLINKMVQTLGFFISKAELPLCRYCVQSRKFKWSPYLKIQGIHENCLDLNSYQLSLSEWPVCIVNVYKRSVYFVPSIPSFFTNKSEVIKYDLAQMINSDFSPKKSVKTKFSLIHRASDSIVASFLAQLDILPYDSDIRVGFIRQFLRVLGHRSLALVEYVKSIRDDIDKSSSDKKKLHNKVTEIRKSLQLEHDGDFWLIVSFCDRVSCLFSHRFVSQFY